MVKIEKVPDSCQIYIEGLKRKERKFKPERKENTTRKKTWIEKFQIPIQKKTKQRKKKKTWNLEIPDHKN